MRFKASLRYRVSFSFALLGLLVSLVLAGGLYLLTIDMEQRLIEETLATELEDYIGRYATDQQTPPPISTTLRTYVISADSVDAPQPLRDLDAGLHHLQLQGRGFYAAVRLSGENRFVLIYDETPIRQRERNFQLFLAGGVLAMVLLSSLLGFRFAGQVIAPVSSLANRVSQLRAGGQPRPLQSHFASDEVGLLAREFDAYLQRLSAFVEREQSFTADVSHELRTPLTVIRGASDVLLEDADLSERQRSRVQRITRSAQEMCELVDALLLLAREERGEQIEAGCEVSELLRQVVEGHRHLLERKLVEVRLQIECDRSLPVAATLFRVVLANLVRNAFLYTVRGSVEIILDERGVAVADTGVGIAQEQRQRIFERFYKGSGGGEGIGLSLVKRICRLHGWRIELESLEGKGSRFRLLF